MFKLASLLSATVLAGRAVGQALTTSQTGTSGGFCE